MKLLSEITTKQIALEVLNDQLIKIKKRQAQGGKLRTSAEREYLKNICDKFQLPFENISNYFKAKGKLPNYITSQPQPKEAKYTNGSVFGEKGYDTIHQRTTKFRTNEVITLDEQIRSIKNSTAKFIYLSLVTHINSNNIGCFAIDTAMESARLAITQEEYLNGLTMLQKDGLVAYINGYVWLINFQNLNDVTKNINNATAFANTYNKLPDNVKLILLPTINTSNKKVMLEQLIYMRNNLTTFLDNNPGVLEEPKTPIHSDFIEKTPIAGEEITEREIKYVMGNIINCLITHNPILASEEAKLRNHPNIRAGAINYLTTKNDGDFMKYTLQMLSPQQQSA